jgi:flagellar protein FlaF
VPDAAQAYLRASHTTFSVKQAVEILTDPDPAKLNSLIDINCNLAAGLAGRG